ncbi:hypothetical protein BOW53_14765 [Solemya pervernicosa gill symbiont]|uniref:J domain-containing protein n=2 Tax=Gammaproteobacteria incertae sedis TaxID=118884 RepID=A0A1T2L0M0_9GAMM|nr:DNA-J related domain-containing protein [Candidatus Reidiella endopervernicosa]OOZ38653.1 hypothetical protein BOW53_14765 [Solemya pervernicosa gill symbiont]QKQ26022.1 DnaJ domain-containing protein [Candidatus Reidiella endopervernicosa]
MHHSIEASYQRLRLPILELLQEHPEGISEYDLLGALEAEGVANMGRAALRDNLTMFQVHFLLFHLLYRLRGEVREEGGLDLVIECLAIKLFSTETEDSATNQQLPVSHDPLEAYYLDLQNFEASTEEIDALIEGFWCRYAAIDRRAEALAVLGLEIDAERDAIKRRYRQLAMQHHPDRGGDKAQLQMINAAMALLKEAG